MKRKISIVSPEQKMTIQLWLGVAVAIFGCIMIVGSFFVPPMGIIDASVLAALGELLTFSGALIGIDYTYKYKVFRNTNEHETERYHRHSPHGFSYDERVVIDEAGEGDREDCGDSED